MQCSQCGADIYEGASFCGECGAPVSGSAQAPAASRPDTKPRSRATVNAERRQRQTATRNAPDQEATTVLADSAPAVEAADKSAEGVAAAAGGAAVAAAGVAAAEAAEQGAEPAGADPISVTANDWDDSPTTIIDPLQVDVAPAPVAAAAAQQGLAQDYTQPYEQPTVQGASYEGASPQEVGAMRPVVERPDRVAGMYEAQQKKKSRRAIAASLLAVALLAGAGGAWFMHQQAQSEAETQAIVQENEAKSQQAKEEAEVAQQQQEVEDRSNATHNVRLSVSGINYDEAGTRVPVQLMGATEAGESINQVAFVGSDGKGITVPAGNYTATVLASPIAANGMLYNVPTEPFDFTITQDMAEEVSTGQAIVLMPIEAADITKDMVDYAYSLAVQDSPNLARAETCKAAADKVVAENDKTSEEEAAKAEKERMRQARPQLAQEFVSNYFTNVMFTNSNDDSEVLLIENWSEVLAPYVKAGTGIANSIAGEKSGSYYAARSVVVSSQDDKTVTVNADVASAEAIEPGWTSKGWSATVKCTFDEDNLITGMEVTTPSGTTKY